MYTAFEEQMLSFMTENKKRLDHHEMKLASLDVAQTTTNSTLKNLETQIGKLSLAIKEQPHRNFPSDIKKNPIDCMVIALRSGKELHTLPPKDELKKKDDTRQVNEEKKKDEINGQDEKRKEEKEAEPVYIPPSPYKPLMPFPQRFRKQKLEEQFGKFLDIFRKLEINIPFVEALAQMPNYVKFMKEIIDRTKLVLV